MCYAAALRGRRQGATWPPAPPARCIRRLVSLAGQKPIACAAGGKGGPPPLHPRPGTTSLGILIRCARMPNAWCVCLQADWRRQPSSRSWHTKSMCRCIYSELTSNAGGLGACYAPNGEREGQARSQDHTRICGSARGEARSQDHTRIYGSAKGEARSQDRICCGCDAMLI